MFCSLRVNAVVQAGAAENDPIGSARRRESRMNEAMTIISWMLVLYPSSLFAFTAFRKGRRIFRPAVRPGPVARLMLRVLGRFIA